mmetsp:Transcript_1885/g.5493  ORF Transcript_1885/g.5493 Transcript_1885/m.5493 type:complete len:441 (-) Transcript_1885:1359-2681(-)
MARGRLAIAVAATLFHFNDAFFFVPLLDRSRSSHRYVQDANRCSDASGSDDADNGGLDAALGRLDLTPAQFAQVQSRLLSVTNSGNQHSKINAEGNLSWLNSRLGLLDDRTRLAAIVTGHPPILGYAIKTNLEPTVAFFQDALQGEDGADVTARLAAFICESPELLEYNVKKRLVPRLERIRAGTELCGPLDEKTLRIIATKTDSRFDEWLLDEVGETQVDTSTADSDNYDHFDQWDEAAQQQQYQNNESPASYVVLSNLQSGGNIGNILRSASIFGCQECVVVGQKRYRLTGDHGSRFDLRRHHTYDHDSAREYLHEKGVRIYGVEIVQGAAPIMRYDPQTGIVHFPFDRQWQGAAFVMGNEGQGLSAKQKEICDEFLFIPQTRGGAASGGGSASLNVACAATVVLQAYCMWAGYPDANREGEKFVEPSSKSERLRFRQ